MRSLETPKPRVGSFQISFRARPIDVSDCQIDCQTGQIWLHWKKLPITQQLSGLSQPRGALGSGFISDPKLPPPDSPPQPPCQLQYTPSICSARLICGVTSWFFRLGSLNGRHWLDQSLFGLILPPPCRIPCSFIPPMMWKFETSPCSIVNMLILPI